MFRVYGQTFSAKQLEALCSRQTIGGSCVPRLRTDVFRQTVGGPVFSPNYWRVLCSASTDRRFPPNSWRPCVLAKLLEGPVFRVYGQTFSTNTWRPCVLRQSLRPIKKHRLLTKLYDWSLNSHADAVFARTLRQILTRVGRVVERIVPLHHAERRGKCNGQSFARMFL